MKHKAKINSLELEGDRKIFDIVKDLDLLSSLQWPQSTIERFITEWEMGNPRLPSVEYPKLRFTDERKKLSDIEGEIKANSPISDYLRKTTQSYRLLLELLENLGTNNVTALSESLYGLPIDSVPASQSNHLKAAEFFLKVCSDHKDSPLSEECILLDAVSVKKLLEEKLSKVFSSGEVKVELNSDLSAKAKTSKNTVFLRKNADFSEYDIDQLLNHEIFIHSLTSINGAAQPLHCLSLDCPRTTEDQEGLATFAEKITGSIPHK